MDSVKALQSLEAAKLVAIIRSRKKGNLVDAAQALADGGITSIEITLTSPNALESIREARTHFGDRVLFGAGSVTNLKEASDALNAGAQFFVCPIFSREVVQFAAKQNTLVLPGCYTPTEMFDAQQAGALAVKLFPADVGGPAYVKAILAPLPKLKLVAVGGVTVDNVNHFLSAGAIAVGIGSQLVNDTLLESGDTTELTKRAKAFVSALNTSP